MKTQSPDTSPEAERALIEITRRLSPERKLQLGDRLGHSMRALMKSGLRERYPQASPEELDQRFVELWLGPELAPAFLAARAARRHA